MGCEVGASVGKVVDEEVLSNYRCLSCGRVFGNE